MQVILHALVLQCILATAFVHYILVCDPNSNYLTDIKLRLIAGLIEVLSCLPLVGKLVDMKLNFFDIRAGDYEDKGFFIYHDSKFIYRCVGFLLPPHSENFD